MTSTRITTMRLRQLTDDLPSRYIGVLPHLDRARLLSGTQLDRLLTEPDVDKTTTARVRRRILTRLATVGLVTTMSRRIGGVRAGSAGHIYTLTTAGHRFLTLTHHQGEHNGQTPAAGITSELFLRHALAISDLYVQLVEASRTHDFTLSRFMTEPGCWWPTGITGNVLRPDAYAVVKAPAHADCWWLEVDQGSETRRRIHTKCVSYQQFATYDGAGPDNVTPRILFTTPDEPRRHVITEVVTTARDSTCDNSWLFTVVTHQQAVERIIAELHTT